MSSVPGEATTEPLHVVLAGQAHEWPGDFETFVALELVARDGALVVRLSDIAEAPALLAEDTVDALIVNADRLGLKGMVVLRECRRISPATAVVAVAPATSRGLKDALEGGATAFVSWPAAPDVLRRALRGGRDPAFTHSGQIRRREAP